MENKNLVILTCKNRFFGQTRKPWTSLKTDVLFDVLSNNGFNVEMYDFHEVFNKNISIKDKTIFYSFSQKNYYRQYINDIIYHLSKSNRIIPSYDLLKCHENKGYQEIFKREIGLNSLNAMYFTSLDEVDFSSLSYPVVLKTTEGTNSKGVFLIKQESDFNKIKHKLESKISFGKKLDLFRRKYFRKKKFEEYPEFSDRQDYIEYKEYIRQEKNFIIQDFVAGLDFDYRVLIAHNRYYVMRRDVKKGDFRASGSKLFKFSKNFDKELLNYSKSVYEKFDIPFLSIDVLYNGSEYYLGEYQALHFGMSAMAKSEGFFVFDNNSADWQFKTEKPELEKVFANTLTAYLEKS
ncbi:MAG: hypothetical protein R6U11_05050 [Bacteroidales bacterium]